MVTGWSQLIKGRNNMMDEITDHYPEEGVDEYLREEHREDERARAATRADRGKTDDQRTGMG